MTAVEHPKPTLSTVRQLYGSAFRCAHPDCMKPLYKLADETGDRVLNSRIAHIHARREGGPRWITMTADDNRAFDNLVLLCIEHSYEVDEHADRFPAELLRQWKTAQIAEYDSVQRSWPINDDEAAEVLFASESFDALHALTTVEVVRRVEALRLVAERTRSGPESWSRRWQQLVEQTRRSLTAWDTDGNPVYLQPSDMQIRPIRDGLQAALTAAVDEIRPLAEAAQIELAAVRATREQVAPWCDALNRAITNLIALAATWPNGADPTADSEFAAALEDLGQRISELVRASRGDEVDVPEVPAPVLEVEAIDPLAEHRALLDEARPFARVDHRPYDAELRERVAQATRQASTIPWTASSLPFGLDATARLANAVAGNATEDEKVALTERDRQRLPICAAVALLQAAALEADKDDASVAAAGEQIRHLWVETDWTDETLWSENHVNGSRMMRAFAFATSDQEVHDRLADSLETKPELLRAIVLSCADWIEDRDMPTFRLIAVVRSYSQVPPWLPVEKIRALAAEILGDTAELDDLQMLDALLQQFGTDQQSANGDVA
jgi:hypothetical protein